MSDLKIYVGAGQDAPDWASKGWLCNDLESGAAIYGSVALIGPCWALAVEDGSVSEIMARGVWEHMTYHEVTWALGEWHRVLAPGGHVTLDAPDVSLYIRKYIQIKERPELWAKEWSDCYPGEPEDTEVCSGAERWLRRAISGWQRYPGDEHRSAWTWNLLDYYLGKYFPGKHEVRLMSESFEDDRAGAEMRHLWARCWK